MVPASAAKWMAGSFYRPTSDMRAEPRWLLCIAEQATFNTLANASGLSGEAKKAACDNNQDQLDWH